MFLTLADRLHGLGFVVMSHGKYRLYVADLSPSMMLIVEGAYCDNDGQYYFDFYKLRYDKKNNTSFVLKVYCEKVKVTSVLKRVEKHVLFLRKIQKEKEVK